MFTKITKIILHLIVLLLVVVACTSAEEVSHDASIPAKIVLTASGSGSVTPILEVIAPPFEAERRGYRLKVLPGSGTGEGVKGVIQKILDIAGMARPPKKEEAAQDVEFVPLGQGASAIITHPAVKVTNLSTAQVIALFAGEISSWSDVGGADLPIILYIRDEEDSNTKILRQSLFNDKPFSQAAEVLTSEANMLVAVEGTPGGIGIATWPTTLAKKTKVEAVTIDGVAPNDSAYPMLSLLGIGYLKERAEDVNPLLDWLSSQNGQAALRRLDIIGAPKE